MRWPFQLPHALICTLRSHLWMLELDRAHSDPTVTRLRWVCQRCLRERGTIELPVPKFHVTHGRKDARP